MADLHPSEPGLPYGHMWREMSRFGMAMRVWLSGVVVASITVLVVTGLGVIDNNQVKLIEVPLAWLLVLAVPLVVFGPIAAFFGQWMKRFYPVTQALLFAVLVVVAVLLVVVVIDAITALTSDCPLGVYCSRFGEATIWVVYLYLGPLFLIAAVSYGFAIWSMVSRRAKKVFWSLLVAVLVLLAAVSALNSMGFLTGAQHSEPAVDDAETRPGPNSPL